MYKICIFILGIILASCNEKTTETADHTKRIDAYFAYFNMHKWTEMASMYAETAEFKDPSLGSGIVHQNRKDIVAKYSALSETFPDVKDSVLKIYPSGDHHVIVEFVSTGTAPDSSRFSLQICTIFKIENGLISEDFTYYDNSQPSP